MSFQTLSLADNIRYFQIEGMRIGDSALDYFSESQLEDNEQGWHNYSYKEYSTSFMPGKGNYKWFLVSYKNDDDNLSFITMLMSMIITAMSKWRRHTFLPECTNLCLLCKYKP